VVDAQSSRDEEGVRAGKSAACSAKGSEHSEPLCQGLSSLGKAYYWTDGKEEASEHQGSKSGRMTLLLALSMCSEYREAPSALAFSFQISTFRRLSGSTCMSSASGTPNVSFSTVCTVGLVRSRVASKGGCSPLTRTSRMKPDINPSNFQAGVQEERAKKSRLSSSAANTTPKKKPKGRWNLGIFCGSTVANTCLSCAEPVAQDHGSVQELRLLVFAPPHLYPTLCSSSYLSRTEL
jgi:hypothetical protein